MTATVLATDHECAWNEWQCPGTARYRRKQRLWLCGEHFTLVEQADAHLTPHAHDHGGALVAVVLTVALVAGLLGLVIAGRHVMCDVHHNQLRYCAGWTATTTERPTR